MFKKIGIVATSSPAKEQRINQGVLELERIGFEVVKGDSVNQTYFDYLSGSDSVRAMDVNKMFVRKDIDIIICQNGGYGTPRIVDKIDYKLIEENKKIFSGFSDVSLLLNTIYMKTGLITYHGPMVSVDFSTNRQQIFTKSFFQLIHNEEIIINDNGEYDITVINEGNCEGILVGGNLSLLCVFAVMEIGDFFNDKILLIEELRESNYRIDRMLQTLRLKGVFDNLKGIIIGGITGDETPQKGTMELCKDVFEDYDYPVIFNAPIGHVTPRYTVPIGGFVSFDSQTKKIRIKRGEK
jgi:muramoyltetrapeptide carboxypeptidase